MMQQRMVRRRVRTLSLMIGGALLLAGVTAAFATDFLQGSSKLVVESTSTRQKLTLMSKLPPPPAPAADPTAVGATFMVINPNTGESATFDLPAAGWSK